MIQSETKAFLTEAQKEHFKQEGYLVVKGLLAADVEKIKDNFMKLHAGGPIQGFNPVTEEEANGDILRRYPRMMHPHRVNELAMEYMIHPQVMGSLADLFEEEPLAVQSMFYFKPPGAKGQALHQDNFYLKVEPGTCIAAWTAIDAADEENGGLVVVPKSNRFKIECPHQADPEVSFTVHEVDVPEEFQVVPVNMEAGDVLFFNGSVVHGSYPNRSAERFRRAFICHYVGAGTNKVGKYYNPVFRANGEALRIEVNEDGRPCGTEFEVKGPH
jgi:ectoine hydroxylase-related dioxygenase (phytanoyl-CoA dioxygenase family)